MAKASDSVGKIINGYEILSIIDYAKVFTRCTTCNNITSRHLASIRQKKVRCMKCNPSMTTLYFNDIKDLTLAGHKVSEIAAIVGCAPQIVSSVKALLVRNGELGDFGDDVEYTFKDIAETLGITASQAKASYDSALRKLRCGLEELDDFKDRA